MTTWNTVSKDGSTWSEVYLAGSFADLPFGYGPFGGGGTSGHWSAQSQDDSSWEADSQDDSSWEASSQDDSSWEAVSKDE